MENKLAIKSSRIVTPEGLIDGIVIIENGKISAITPSIPADFSGEIVEAKNHFVMPGLIDPHVHINEPGRTDWEGFETATLAAASSGITTLVDMPLNSTPVTTNTLNFQTKLDATKNKLNVNVGFWGGVEIGRAHV